MATTTFLDSLKINLLTQEQFNTATKDPNQIYAIKDMKEDSGYVHPSYTPRASGLYKFTVDDTGHVSQVSSVAKTDITALGIPAQDTIYANFVKSGTGAKSGLVPAPSTTAGTTKYLREDGTWAVPPDTNTTYTHPSSHAATMITQDASHRFVTDAEKTAWSEKSTVTFTRSLTSGTKVGSININGTNTDLYAPSAVPVVNNLTSTSTTSALSAAMGKSLKDSIDSITGDIGNLGGGDMMKASYDSNNNGIVDDAEKLGGQSPSYYATAGHGHSSYANQNAFSNIKVGTTTVAADTTTDTLELVAGSNVTITPDATNDKVTISATDTKYTHPATSGNKHIPSGGSSGQFLKWSADGTAVWANDNNTTYSNFKGATSSTAGGSGLVPTPAAGAQAKYLCADGTWQTPPDTNTTYSDMKGATTSAAGTHGLVPAPSAGAANRYLRSDGVWVVPPDTDTKYTHPNSGATAGTYKSVTINAQGHVTGGTNPTTLSGYGITDAVPTSRTINGKPLSSNISLSASDVGADASGAANTALSSAKSYIDTKITTWVGDTTVASQISGKANTSNGIYTVTTGGTGAAYTATVPSITALVAGANFIMKPHTTSTSISPTLNVNGLGAKTIKRRLNNNFSSKEAGYSNGWIAVDKPFYIIYDGLDWIIEGQNKPVAADLYGSINTETQLTGNRIWLGDNVGLEENGNFGYLYGGNSTATMRLGGGIADSRGVSTGFAIKDTSDSTGYSSILTSNTGVKQGGGVEQKNNQIYIGWDGNYLRTTVDNVDLGKVVTTAGNNFTYFENFDATRNTANNPSASTYTFRYYPFLRMCFARIYIAVRGGSITFNSGTIYNMYTLPAEFTPPSRHALSGTCTKRCDFYVSTDGINIAPREDITQSYLMYISGWWTI